MENYDLLASDPSWLLLGPQLAMGLFFFLVLYTVALRGTTARAPIPGLGWLRSQTIYRDLVLGLGLLATVPAVALVVVLTSRAADQREERAMELLAETSAGIATGLDQYFEKYQLGIASLTASIQRAGRFDVRSLTEWLESHHALYRDYLTMLAANTRGDIVTATTMVQGQPERISTLNQNISDRDYFITPMRDDGVYVSDVFKGRGLGNDPIVAVSAVLHTQDAASWGIVEGSLDLERLSRFRPAMKTYGQHVDLLVLDQRARVIFSSDPNRYATLETVNVARLLREDNTRFVTRAESDMGWQVFASVSRQPIHSQVWSDVRITLLWLLAAILIAISLSAAIARRVTRPLATLNEAVRALDLEGSEADISPPPGAPDEIREVFSYMNSMSDRLHNSYRQLTAAIEAGKHYREQLETTLSRREVEIRSRTNELEYQNRNLQTLSHVDQLTGLANRRRFTEAAEQVWRHCIREQQPASIVIMDIDHFKAFNDTYGHQDGDNCLAKIGGALSACIWRPLDLVARYGGEEFIMILANTDLPDSLAVAERTRRVIEDLAIPHAGSTLDSTVTMSLGAASEIPARDSNYNALIQCADRALYHAKDMGRNCVAWAGPEKMALYQVQDPTTLPDGDQVVRFPAAKGALDTTRL